jgi:STE24 endopeptidase
MNESKATRYQRLRRRVTASGALLAGVVLSVVALTPLSRWLRDMAVGVTGGAGPSGQGVATCALFVFFLVLLWETAAFPAAAYAALRIDRVYGQRSGTVAEILAAHLKASAMAVPPAALGSAVVLVSVNVAGPGWWIWAGLVLVLLLAAAMHFGPILLAGLADVRPFSRPDVMAALDRIAMRVRVPVGSVSEWVLAEGDPTTALVTGMGRQRRILVSSELIRHWSDDEIAVVIAHELAHHAYRDLWRALALNAVVLWSGLFVSDRVLVYAGSRLGLGGPGDLAALPLIALIGLLVWVAATPLRHAQSRKHERRADVFALAMTGGADAFRRAIRRLSAQHLVEERPSRLTRWFYHRHPTVAERLALADAYSRIKNA